MSCPGQAMTEGEEGGGQNGNLYDGNPYDGNSYGSAAPKAKYAGCQVVKIAAMGERRR